MARTRKNKKKIHGPVFTIFILGLVISILSLVLNLIGFQAHKTEIVNGVLETTLITVKNIISYDGLEYFIGNAVTNFRNFEPLVVIIISLVGLGLCEKSGLLYAFFSPIKKIKFGVVTFFTVILGVLSTIIGDYSYLFLIPYIGVMYKYLDKNPMLGVITVYLGITLGYGAGIIFNYNDYLLGTLTEAAALDVDKNYTYSLFSNIYIMVFATLLLSFVITQLINKFISPKYPKRQILEKEEQELNVNKTALRLSLLSTFVLLLCVAYMILDVKLPGAGILLDHSGDNYIAKLFASSSPFREGIVILLGIIMILSGLIYGKVSGNIKNSVEYSLGLSKNFENLGFMFVLMFFMSQLTAVLNWTGIGEVIGCKLVEMVSNLQISGLPLIITFFFIVVIISFFIPDVVTKWKVLAPTVVPLFMRANITPSFTLFIFKAADSIGKAFTPLFAYYIIMLAFIEKYRTDEKRQVSIFGVLKVMLPVIICTMITWLLLLCLWYLINFPIGLSTYATI